MDLDLQSNLCKDEQSNRQNLKVIAKKNRLVLFGATVTLLLCIGTLLLNHFTFALHVKVDGEIVGTLSDTDSLEAVIYSVEETAQNLLGLDIDLSDRVSYSLRFIPVAVSENLDDLDVQHNMLDQVDGIDVSYAIHIDGELAGHVTDMQYVEQLIEDRTLDLKENGAVAVTFLSDITFEVEVVESDEILVFSEIYTLVSTLSTEVVEEVIYTQEIPYELTIIYDDSLFIGEYEVLQVGESGQAEILAQVTSVDEREIGHIILDTKTLTEPLSHIVVLGTLERPLTASFDEYIWPTEGTLTSRFGPRRVSVGSSNHQGIDISAPAGTAVVAADGGEVVFAGRMGGFGNLIQIRHDNDHVTFYAHLSSMTVGVGERVYRGQFIGGVGMTGTASGNHLHFEIRINGVPVDPLPHLP